MVEEQNQLISDARKKGGAGRAQASTSAASSLSSRLWPRLPRRAARRRKPPQSATESLGVATTTTTTTTTITRTRPPPSPSALTSATQLHPKTLASSRKTPLSPDRVARSPRALPQRKSPPPPPLSSSSAKRKSTSTATAGSSGGSEAEQRLTRLKKLVLECGVRKQWKKLYTAAGVSDTDFNGQCKVVQDVLRELGMTGKGSIEQARKIREEREFADELAGLQENE